MKDIVDGMDSKWKKKTLENLTEILFRQNLLIKDAVICGRLSITEDTNLSEDLKLNEKEREEYTYAVLMQTLRHYHPDKRLKKIKTIGDYMNYLAKEEIMNRR
ncbi:MAG: hypothetical protein M1416_00415 [Candidatus Pacearchaeota archaeon]|nr:hypothetical protein [Candidatus Pacearchaeota archaeon]